MTPTLTAAPLPLRYDSTGTIRIRDLRIRFDQIIEATQSGATPQDLVEMYDGLTLSDVHAALWYYHAHREEADEYLRRREEEAAEIRRKIEARQPPRPSKAELLARRERMRQGDVPAGD